MKSQVHKIIYWIIFAVVFVFTFYGATRIDSGGPCNAGIVMVLTMMAALFCSGLLLISFLLLKTGERGKSFGSILLSLFSLSIWTFMGYDSFQSDKLTAVVNLGEFEIMNLWTLASGLRTIVKTKAV
jgi:hypothetical protein